MPQRNWARSTSVGFVFGVVGRVQKGESAEEGGKWVVVLLRVCLSHPHFPLLPPVGLERGTEGGGRVGSSRADLLEEEVT